MNTRMIIIAVILALVLAFLLFYIFGKNSETGAAPEKSSEGTTTGTSSGGTTTGTTTGTSSGNSVCVGPDMSLYKFDTNPATPEYVIKSCHGLISDDKSHIFVQQSDGNLVVYNTKTASPIWALNLGANKIDFGSGAPNTTIYQFDSNMVTYNKDGKPIWSSGSGGKKSAALVMQEDGNLVIYSETPIKSGSSWGGPSIWSTGTAGL